MNKTITPEAAAQLLATANAWRITKNYTDGVVVIFDGAVNGWVDELRDPNHWAPDCIAVNTQGELWIAAGGNAHDGAARWDRLSVPLSELPTCPCCLGNNLEQINLWREDYEGPGVECNDCMTSAPLDAWMRNPRETMLEIMLHPVLLFDYEGERSEMMALPFVPFPGLHIQVPFMNGNYRAIHQVYWDACEEHFVVYLNEGECDE